MIWPQICYNGVRVVDFPSPTNVRRLDLGAMPMVLHMQKRGILVDKPHFHKFSSFLKDECAKVTEEIRESTGYYINVGSPDQIADLLFSKTKLGLKAPPHFKLTKSGKRFVVDDEALTSIKALHPCIERIQYFTECNKLKTSYADVLPVIADPKDGRVRTNLRITRQVGGRISSSDPNLMAQPTRTGLGKMIRKGFVAEALKILATIDQSQIEMRMAAHLFQCVSMMDTFMREGDVHVETACRIFFAEMIEALGFMPDKKQAVELLGMDDMQHRYPAKRIGFGVLFGIEAAGLRDQILVAESDKWTEADRQKFIADWPETRCQKTIEDWFRAYPEIKAGMQAEHSKARRFGKVWDFFGRIRWIPEMKSVHRRIVSEGCRNAGSHRVSSSATGTMKLFMAESFDYVMKTGKYESKTKAKIPIEPLLSVHDEVLWEGDPQAIADTMPIFANMMSRVVRIDVPIRSNWGAAQNWGDIDK